MDGRARHVCFGASVGLETKFSLCSRREFGNELERAETFDHTCCDNILDSIIETIHMVLNTLP